MQHEVFPKMHPTIKSSPEECFPIHLFPFHELPSVIATDYEKVSTIANQMITFVKHKSLYDKSQNYLSATLDFLLSRSSFLMKDDTHQDVFELILQVVRHIVKEFSNASVVGVFSLEIKQIVHMLFNLLNSAQPYYIKTIGCDCITNLIEFADVNSSELANTYQLVLDVFRNSQSILAFGNFMYSILNRFSSLSNEMRLLIRDMEMQCVLYLNQQIPIEELLQLLKCLVLLYKKESGGLLVVENMTSAMVVDHLHLICANFYREDFRPSANYLLSIIILKSKYLNWEFPRIRSEIENLPSDFNKWPYSENDMFFIIACYLYCNSDLMWTSKSILVAIDNHLLKNTVPNPEILKAIIMLYSEAWRKPTSELFNCEKVLFSILNSYKSLDDVLMLYTSELEWLLQNAEPPLKARVIKFWLESEQSEDKILEIIETLQMGHHLVQFLLHVSHAPITILVAKIISKLTPNYKLTNAIYNAIPQICNQPEVLGYLLQVNEEYPKTIYEIKNFMKIISLALPFFIETESIKAGCWCLRKLFDIGFCISEIPLEPDHLMNFLHCLIAHAVANDDETALEALNLLTTLMTNRVLYIKNTKTEDKMSVPFIKILRGSDQRILKGLQLLLLILKHAKKNICLQVSRELVCSLYVHIHSLVNQKNINLIFEIFNLLLIMEPNLSYSTLTFLFLKIAPIKYVNNESRKSYDAFVKAFHRI